MSYESVFLYFVFFASLEKGINSQKEYFMVQTYLLAPFNSSMFHEIFLSLYFLPETEKGDQDEGEQVLLLLGWDQEQPPTPFEEPEYILT